MLGNQPDPDAFGAGELFGANSQVDGYWDLVFVSKIVNVNAEHGWNSNSPLGPICLEISWSPTYEYRTIPGGGGSGGSNGGPGIGGARTGSSGGGGGTIKHKVPSKTKSIDTKPGRQIPKKLPKLLKTAARTGSRFLGATLASVITFFTPTPLGTDDQQFDEDLPIFYVVKEETPETYQHTVDAIMAGQPFLLTYLGPRSPESKSKRRKAKSQFREEKEDGHSIDEYPYATTFEGGLGASVRLVRVSEQYTQAGLLSQFYQKNNMTRGSQFYVIPVLKRPVE